MKIIKVHPESLGTQIGLKPGDKLIKINNQRVKDEIDYQFKISEQLVKLQFEIDGSTIEYEIEKDYDDTLGVEFEEFKIRACANDCVFCFVDQNPEGMRSELYFRDGDFRLSYLHGHYITMTNMGQKQLDRIVEQKLSPLYLSVHITDVELRKKLLLYKQDDKLLDKIKFLTDNDIELHTQIVLMPTLNDGKYLLKTIDDLYKFYPKLKSLSIVPVGLTKHRKGLIELQSVDKKYAERFIQEIDSISLNYKTDNNPFIMLSDEWYLICKKELPPTYDYDDLDLVENGVGQVRSFMDNFEKEKIIFPKKFSTPTKLTIVTGMLIYEYFKKNVVDYLNQNIDNLEVQIIGITNNFYGDVVNVAGLLTGRDIINQLIGKDLGSSVWLSHRVLNDDRTMTLDNMTLDDISNRLNVTVNISDDSILDILESVVNV
tara:strand:- start:1014 stop:2303 length:1290 start_codon:yes stop_codon:yes gene_type:complete